MKRQTRIILPIHIFLLMGFSSEGNQKCLSDKVITGRVEFSVTKTNCEGSVAGNSSLMPQNNVPDNTLSEKEIKDDWKLLFDGKTSSGWMNGKTKRFPSGGWEIKDGTLTIDPETRGSDGGGDIVTSEKYRNFEILVDFKYKSGANSGIKYFIDIETNNGEFASIGCEYQILDDKLHPDAREGISGNHTMAGLYDLIAPLNKNDNGPDRWNRAMIVVNGSKVQHWLNDRKTVEYERATGAWRDLVAGSKFKGFKGFGEAAEGRILLQDHGDIVSFKNIKIREIKK